VATAVLKLADRKGLRSDAVRICISDQADSSVCPSSAGTITEILILGSFSYDNTNMKSDLRSVAGLAQGALYELRQQGPRALLNKRWTRIRMQFSLDETHVWYELKLNEPRPRPALPPGMRLVRGGFEELPVLRQLPNISDVTARRRLAAGDGLWLVLDGEKLAFACWVFHDAAETPAAPGGRITLPRGIVFVEDSITSPAYRGKAIAPAAWASIGDSLAEAGNTSLITKVEGTNQAVIQAMKKSGILEIATVHYTRNGPFRRTFVEARPDANAEWLTGQLVL